MELDEQEPTKAPTPKLRVPGWVAGVIAIGCLVVGGWVGNATAHSTKAPGACLSALEWADQVMDEASTGLNGGGTAGLSTAVDQYLEQKAKCRNA